MCLEYLQCNENLLEAADGKDNNLLCIMPYLGLVEVHWAEFTNMKHKRDGWESCLPIDEM